MLPLSDVVKPLFRYDITVLLRRQLLYYIGSSFGTGRGELVLRLSHDDPYGLRDALVDCAADYLPKSVIRDMIASFQESVGTETDRPRKGHGLLLVESLARQLKDAQLFEKTRMAYQGELNAAACIDIAEVYLESGDPRTALSWLEKFPEDTFGSHRRSQLLFAVYGALGEREKQVEMAWKIFRSARSAASLAELLAVIGEDRREQVIAGEAELMLQSLDFI